jgi:hypothetical protein
VEKTTHRKFYMYSQNIFADEKKRKRLARHVAHTGDRRRAYIIFVGRIDGKKTLRRPRIKWDDNIKMNVQDLEWRRMGWNNLSHDRVRWRRLVNAVMDIRASYDMRNFLTR